MKRAQITASMALLLSLIIPPVIAGEVLDSILKSRIIRVATDSNWPPQSFINDSNEMDGFDVEVARQIAERMSVGIEFTTPSWDLITSGNWKNRWDLHVGSMKTDSIADQKLDFPAVYYYTPSVVAVHRDASTSRVSQLSGKAIGAGIGTSHESYLQGKLITDSQRTPAFSYVIKNARVSSYENSAYALDDLRLGDGVKLDAVIASMPTILDAISKGNPLKIIGKPVFYEPLVISIETGDAEFNQRLGDIINEMHSDGTLSKLSMKWYRVDYTSTE